MVLPNPWQRGHAPNGLLNENSFGSGSSYRMPHFLHSNDSLNRNCFHAASSRSGGPIEDFENDFAIVFPEADLDGIDQPLPDVRSNFQAIDQHVCRFGEIDIEQGFRPRVIEDLAVLVNPAETSPFQVGQERGELILRTGFSAMDRGRRTGCPAATA